MMEAPNVALLIAGCRRREEASQLALYRHFYSYGMGICLRYARNRESAMEMLNDGFLKVFQKIEQYDSADGVQALAPKSACSCSD
jgi:DNA-directed RNA polymerase specialized sigma24 family protein